MASFADLKPRNHQPLGRVIESGLSAFLLGHPEAFDALLFKAVKGSEEDVAVAGGIIDVVGSMESSERSLDYADPVKTRAFLLPDDGISFYATTDGAGETEVGIEQPLAMLLLEPDVPKYSVVRWQEYDGTGLDAAIVSRTFYVFDAKPAGRGTGAGMVYFILPMSSPGELPQEV